MRTKEELEKGCGELLHNLRVKQGLSKAQIADKLYLDPHTWARYERGEATPSVADFVRFYDALHDNAMRYTLEYLYPDIYKENNNIADTRAAAVHFFSDIFPARYLEILRYMMIGNHGSNAYSQLEMLCMYEHLPLKYRYVIAETIDNLYAIAESENALINTDEVMPNVQTFRDGLEKGEKAAMLGKTGYTTAVE